MSVQPLTFFYHLLYENSASQICRYAAEPRPFLSGLHPHSRNLPVTAFRLSVCSVPCIWSNPPTASTFTSTPPPPRVTHVGSPSACVMLPCLLCLSPMWSVTFFTALHTNLKCLHRKAEMRPSHLLSLQKLGGSCWFPNLHLLVPVPRFLLLPFSMKSFFSECLSQQSQLPQVSKSLGFVWLHFALFYSSTWSRSKTQGRISL